MGCFTGLDGVAEALAMSLARVTGHLPPDPGAGCSCGQNPEQTLSKKNSSTTSSGFRPWADS